MPYVLTINGGSSTLKFAVFAAEGGLQRRLAGVIDRIGLPDGRLRLRGDGADKPHDVPCDSSDHSAAVAKLMGVLDEPARRGWSSDRARRRTIR
jgi:acetate kinase